MTQIACFLAYFTKCSTWTTCVGHTYNVKVPVLKYFIKTAPSTSSIPASRLISLKYINLGDMEPPDPPYHHSLYICYSDTGGQNSLSQLYFTQVDFHKNIILHMRGTFLSLPLPPCSMLSSMLS